MLKFGTIFLAVTVLSVGLVAGYGTIAPASGHTGATGVVKQRMELMKSMAAANKALKRLITARGAPTAARRKAIARNAAAIEGHALKMLTMFPKGSDKHPSEALPSVWQDRPGFEKSAKELAAAAWRLKTGAATADRKALLGGFVAMARTCGGCHRQYRKKQQR